MPLLRTVTDSRRFSWHGARLGALVSAALLGCRAPASRESLTLGGARSAGTFRAAAEATLPALVFVQVEGIPTLGGSLGSPLVPAPSREEAPEPVVTGAGSGFILTADGLILTNNHVVREAVAVSVVLSDSRRFEATVVGRDPNTDIAVLRVEAVGLPAAPLGDSDSLLVGDWVLALGYPLGLSATVTAGIVSATGRSLGILREGAEAVAPLEHFIQTDAAINPGNSGGPMVDLAGRVVGVNSVIASPTGYYAGYAFAVPINIARRVADDLVRFGEVQRPALGLRIESVAQADAEVYELPAVAGAEVVGMLEGGPAAVAGFELGDVIVTMDSTPIRTPTHLEAIIAQHRPGDRVRFGLLRYGRPKEVVVTLGRLPGRKQGTSPPPVHAGPARLGFAVGVNDGSLVVLGVAGYSPALRAGIRPGQRILALNRRPVRTVAEFEAALRAIPPPAALSLRVIDPVLGETIINYEPEPRHRAQGRLR